MMATSAFGQQQQVYTTRRLASYIPAQPSCLRTGKGNLRTSVGTDLDQTDGSMLYLLTGMSAWGADPLFGCSDVSCMMH